MNQTAIGVPALCNAERQSLGFCSVYETGFQERQVAISFQKPTCPDDYYVMGHIALRMAVRPHKSLATNKQIVTPFYARLHPVAHFIHARV
jgi:hypothetical protein